MKKVYKDIKKVAFESPQEEVCGFVLKKGDEIFIQEAFNEAEDPENHFQINPLQYLKAIKSSDEVLAVYHSHPFGSEEPSDFDVKMSNHCCLDFLIYSLEADKFNLLKYNG